ncbi:DNA topoisomerase III [Desulfosporosinus acidiphilus SJ4]|uniref:DNA topoisomerase 3 n=1 Tax=Desulfosporosinus acidiphilus (strain DSM 22704 / JCM 16185 / SJ4) TaxID=646529 RepID=I4D320_DESAJ|nr:DNA topoisomerase III [Desulfosporosinus acidiphilus]AFM40194.1 DNA topoisomerase III [Desulfosporosinus acidiphilus SJ4]
MGKTLVLTEKPSVGREVARILKCSRQGNGCLIGEKYIVVWALGHLVTLADPEAYDASYKIWRAEDLPMLPAKMELVVIRETAKQFGIVKNMMRNPEVDELIIATDAGREGELVARWIIKKAGWRKPIKRLWISSLTERAIRDGFNHLRPGKDFETLYAAAECRAEADWLVGLNVTRALTCKFNAQLSAGRVQTPTLAMIVEREKEIKEFVPQDYWSVAASAQSFDLRWQDKNGQTRIFNKIKADEILTKVKGHPGEIIDIKKEAKHEPPPLAYDLTELQRDANRKFGFSAKTTSNIMQQLYENHKLVTYPRTDSRYISDDIVPTLPERLKSVAQGPYVNLARGILRTKPNVTKRFVDNSKVSDHHAIIPTEQPAMLNRLSSDELKIYDLIVRRFLAVLLPPFEYQQTTVKMKVNGEVFTTKGRIVLKKGWKDVYAGDYTGAEDEDEGEAQGLQTLPEISLGDRLKSLSIRLDSHKTKPPSRHTEATLLYAMEHPAQMIEDRQLRDIMAQSHGLGTPATRAEIIEKLFNSFYMNRQGKEIVPTSKGIQLINLVPEELKSPELTAQWEQQLNEISKGRVNAQTFLKDMRQYAAQLVSTVNGSSQFFKHDNLTRTKCPNCGKFLLQVKGKKGEMYVCQDRECGYRQNISQMSNARCPECHKKMELRGEGESKLFFCTCGYREKLSAFKKRKEAGNTTGNKKEVSAYLRKQNEDALKNTALADALAKLQLKK